MGTVLTNPFELNFGGLAARNAENIKEAETTSGLLSSETRTTSCNSIYPNLQVEIYEQTRVHPNPYNNPNLAVTCEGYYYPDNPGNGDRNCGTRYEVKGKNGNVKGTSRPLYIPASDFQGDIFTKGSKQYYSSLVDARMVRDAEVAHWNVFRSEAGCKNSQALNYSPGASTGNCPCTSAEPVWTQGVKPMDGNPSLQSVAEKPGDCSCLMPPTNLDGQGYLVEEWKYVGTPFPTEYDSNDAQLTDQWKWERNTSKSVLPQAGNDDILYAIAKPGWKATGLNPPQEFIVKENLSPLTWDKYRLITATGFAKIGCLDNTAMNYDSEATIDSQDCKYCTDSDENATIFNQETQKCECLPGYTLQSGVFSTKCKKSVAKSGTNKGGSSNNEEDEGISVGTLMAGIAGITVLGLTVLGLSGGKSNE